MQFTTREDIEAPIEHVFAQVSDFSGFERSVLRRGAEVERVEDRPVPSVGMAWDVRFPMRGKTRDMHVEMTEYDAPNHMVFKSTSQGIEGELRLDLVALSRGRTRLSLSVELAPKTLSARLLVQSLKLARTNLNKRFHLKVAGYAKELEDRFARTA